MKRSTEDVLSDTTNSPTASESSLSSSELTSSDVARTVRSWRSPSSSKDDRSLYGASPDSSSVAEAWTGYNARELSPLLKFAHVDSHLNKGLYITPGTPLKYQVPLPVFAPYIPYPSIEEIPDDESEGYLERSSGSSHYSHETS
jgi:hypothetical protein